MFKHMVLLLTFAIAVPSYATDTTFELLKAPWVRDRLVFQITADGKLQARRDGDNSAIDIDDGDAFVLSEQRDLTFANFNPFLITIQTSETTEKDPNFESIATLLDAIQKMAEGGLAAASDASDADSRKDQNDKLRAALRELDALSAPSVPLAAGSEDCSTYDRLRLRLRELHTAMITPFLDADEVNGWKNDATSAAKIKDVQKKIDAVVKDLKTNVELLAKIDKEIGEKFVPRDATAFRDESVCSEIHASTFAIVYDVSRHLSASVEAKRKLATDLAALSKSLEPYADATRWRNDHPDEYIFFKPKPDMANVKILAMTFKPRDITVEAGPSLKITEGKSVSRTIRIRQYAMFVPEMSTAVITTDLKYPKYGTKDESGKTIVADAGEDDFPASGAVALNFVCRCWKPTFVYPAVQFGVTNAKEYPGFLLGAGLRFTAPRALSVVGGIIYTWHKELVGLKVGDEVKGTADIESHLQRRGKQAGYVGIQYNF